MSEAGKVRTLLVPVSLDALVVAGKELKSLDLTPRMDVLNLGFLSLANPLNPQQEPIPLGKGIHLHWTLPAALTHGFQTETGEFEFPPVPNRWLVMRVPVEPNLTTRAWVLQSDYVGDKGRNDFVFRDQKQKKYVSARIGRFSEYKAGWKPEPQGTFDLPLTAVGPGNPAFAAFYPGCRNVFGFHDLVQDANEKEIAKGTFLYFVAGWYASQKDDPLDAINQPEDLKNALGKWRARVEDNWLKPLQIPAGELKPNRTLCHATLHSVMWDSTKTTAMPLTADLKTALGNTAIEALSALARPVGEEKLEPLLSAFQYDILANRDVLSGIPELDAELHRRRFYPVKGGMQWILQPIERPAGTEEAKKQPPPFPEAVKKDFNKLCEAQREYDRFARELTWLGECYQAGKVVKSLSGAPQLDTYLTKLATDITEINRQRKTEKEAVQTSVGELLKNTKIQTKHSSNPQAEYELVAAPAPEFSRPSDPAILFANSSVSGEHRYGTRRQSPHCRLLDGVRGKRDFSDVVISAQPEEFPLKLEASLPVDELKALYYESLWLDPQRAEDLSRDPGLRTRQDDIRGKVDSITAWSEHAWHPLFMVWEVLWRPSYSNPAQWNASKTWEIGHTSRSAPQNTSDSEYRWTGGEPAGGQPERYQGWAPLSPSLIEQLEQLKGGVAVFDPWKNVLTQSTGGLTDLLIALEQTIQLPPLEIRPRDPDDVPPKNPLDADELVSWWLGPAPRWIPLETSMFSPIRAGHLKLSQAWLVDAFGRKREIIPGASKVYVTESLGGGTGPPDRWIPLPPRITQPSRLACAWISAAEIDGKYPESNSNPDTSPILGWVVPNYFDRSLVLCDASGRVRNELRYSGNQVTLSEVPDCTPLQQGDSKTSHLTQFADGLRQHGWDALKQLLELIDWVSQRIITPAARQLDSTSLILGQPLVLARASLELEVWGGLASAPFGNTFEGLKASQFPVRLGDVDKGSDCLVGYFLDRLENNKQLPDYSTMRLTYGAQTQGSKYFVPNDDVKVSPAAGPLHVTLLLDPRARVHFASGILPTQSLELPEHVVSEALKKIELSFQVRPVLANQQGVRLPLPEEVAGSWVWLDPERDGDKVTWRKNPAVANKDSGAAVCSEPVQIYEGWLEITKTQQ